VTDIKLPNLHSAGQASNQSNDTGHHPPAALSTVISPCFTRASRSFVSEPQRHTCPVLRPPTLCHRLRASAAARCNAPLLLPCAAHSSSMCRHTAARLLEERREGKRACAPRTVQQLRRGHAPLVVKRLVLRSDLGPVFLEWRESILPRTFACNADGADARTQRHNGDCRVEAQLQRAAARSHNPTNYLQSTTGWTHYKKC
jgi:hypothetical protein